MDCGTTIHSPRNSKLTQHLMDHRFRTISGFIVKNLPMAEADAYITILTPEHGKMRAIGRGALSVKSRRRTALQPLTKSTLLLERHHEHWYVREAHIEKNLLITEDAQKQIHFLAQILKIIDRLVPYETLEMDHAELFHIVEEAYGIAAKIKDKESASARYILHIFCAKILTLLGLFPEFSTDAQTDLSHKIALDECVRTLLRTIRHESCTKILETIPPMSQQKTIMTMIQKIYRRVVTENTSCTVPMRSMTVASSS